MEGNSKLILAKGSNLTVGDYCYIGKNTSIVLSENSEFTIANRSGIESSSFIIVHSKWEFGEGSSIASFCQIFSREHGISGKFIVGNGSRVGDYSIIDVSGDIYIGNNVAIGPRATIYTHDHDYRNSRAIPWKGKALTKAISIEDGVWIGSNVTILPGVTIGKGAIVAAGSVVNKSIEPFSLYGGIPAKKIKEL
nr:acyltransferase [Flavihumibacter rivuli]